MVCILPIRLLRDVMRVGITPPFQSPPTGLRTPEGPAHAPRPRARSPATSGRARSPRARRRREADRRRGPRPAEDRTRDSNAAIGLRSRPLIGLQLATVAERGFQRQLLLRPQIGVEP